MKRRENTVKRTNWIDQEPNWWGRSDKIHIIFQRFYLEFMQMIDEIIQSGSVFWHFFIIEIHSVIFFSSLFVQSPVYYYQDFRENKREELRANYRFENENNARTEQHSNGICTPLKTELTFIISYFCKYKNAPIALLWWNKQMLKSSK